MVYYLQKDLLKRCGDALAIMVTQLGWVETKGGLVLHECYRYSVILLNLEIHCDVNKFIMA